MDKFEKLRFAMLAIAALSPFAGLPAAHAATTLIPIVEFPGSDPDSTGAIDINDNDIIVGSYTTANYSIQHGFFGTLDGNYTGFDYGSGSGQTFPRAINNDGWITGYAQDTTCSFVVAGCEFARDPNGDITTISKGGVPLDGIAQGITSKAKSVGSYFNSDGSAIIGYFAAAGKYKRDITVSLCTDATDLRGINSSGAMVGYCSGHGFLLQNGVETQIDYPDANAISTILEDINDKGLITGDWLDANYVSHAFKFDTASNTFTPIKIRGATFTQAWGANKAGLIAVASDVGEYIYCPHKLSKCPSSAKAIEIPDELAIRMPFNYFKSVVCSHGCSPDRSQGKARARTGSDHLWALDATLGKHP